MLDRPSYISISKEILEEDGMMLFLMGARQVGKTTISKMIAQNYQQSAYFNWDLDQHRCPYSVWTIFH